MADEKQYKTVDKFDLVFGELKGLPVVSSVRETTRTTTLPVIGAVQTHIVQTLRHAEDGDYIFLQYIDADKFVRLVLPPKVADVIASQRDALTGKNRRRAARERADRDKAAGVVPGFMRKPKTKKKGGRRGGPKAKPAATAEPVQPDLVPGEG